MGIFKNKFLLKLIAFICIFLTLMNFVGSSRVYATDSEKDTEVWGGVLIKPITKLMVGIGDAIMEILHESVQTQEATFIKIGGETWWEELWATICSWTLGILVAVAVVLVVASFPGLGAILTTAIHAGTWVGATSAFTLSISLGGVVTGVGAGILAGTAVKEGMIPDVIFLPAFSISAEEIFADKIHLFDINFFEDESDKDYSATREVQVEEPLAVSIIEDEKYKDFADSIWDASVFTNDIRYTIKEYMESVQSLIETYGETDMYYSDYIVVKECFNKIFAETGINYNEDEKWEILVYKTDVEMPVDERYVILVYIDILYDSESKYCFMVHNRNDNNRIYCFKDENAQIAKEEVGTNIHFNGWDRQDLFSWLENPTIGVTGEEKIPSTATQLRGIITEWYFKLRNFALLVLMLVLIYSGIRIVIGSTAGEKAKYKERLMDWLVAMCLLFIMHYIMVFAVQLTEQITELVSNINENAGIEVIELTKKQKTSADKVLADVGYDTLDTGGIYDEAGRLVWPTDLVGKFKIKSQITEDGTTKWLGYSICYCILVLFTLFFAFTYLRRVVYMAFLTIIAPLVAMTYPIDKITDGKAQAFNTWLKEYIFNLLIQPMHLILYTVLVSSAYKLASDSPLYAIVAIGFMMPAEKLVRSFFGFEKAKTPGLLNGAAGAALAMSGLQKIFGGHKSSTGKASANSSKANDDSKLKFANRNSIDKMRVIAGEDPTFPAVQDDKGNVQENGNNIKQQYDSRLTQEQKDEMMAEGIMPGSQEYDMQLRQYGINPAVNPGTEGASEEEGAINPEDPSEPQIKPRYLTQKEIDDMKENGIMPGSQEYYERLNQLGIDIAGEESGAGDTYRIHQHYSERLRQPRTLEEIRRANGGGGFRHLKRQLAPGVRAITAYGKEAGKQLAVKAIQGFHPVEFAGRVVSGATLAAAGGILGAASGDIGNVGKYMATGYVAGSGVARSLSNDHPLDTEAMKREAEMAAHGANYKNVVVERQTEQFKKSADNINYLKQTLGVNGEEARDIMNTTGDYCIRHNVSDIEDIAAIHNLTTGEDAMSLDLAISARDYARKRLPADTDTMTQKSINDTILRWQEEYRVAGYGDTERCNQLAKQTWNSAIKFNKAKSDLTKI